MKDKVYSKWMCRVYTVIIVITTFFGFQIMRSFFSLLTNYYRERPNISLTDVGIYAAITFLLVFFTGFLFKFLKFKSILWIIAAGISIVRLILQIVPWAPFNMAAAAVGTILWIAGIIFFISLLQLKKLDLFKNMLPGIIIGISLDTAFNGLFGTWDMVWRPGVDIILEVLFFSAVLIGSVYRVTKNRDDFKLSDGSKKVYYTTLLILPWILLQMLKLQNPGAFVASSGYMLNLCLLIMLITNIAALALANLFKITKVRIVITVISAALLMASFWPYTSGILYAIQVIAGQMAAVWILMIILYKATDGIIERSPWRNTISVGLGGLLFFICAFIYYGSYDLVLPFENWAINIFIASVLGICGLVSAAGRRVDDGSVAGPETILKPIFAIAVLLVIPVLMFIPGRDAAPGIKDGPYVKIINYNIHQGGFNIDGFQDLESIARIIESSDAEIISLQEVSRGWLINGSADSMYWLSERLNMEYIFMPASDLIWGNAVLSKYPMKLIKSGYLPSQGVALQRSYLLVEVEVRKNKKLNILCTHLHHLEDGGSVREKQVEALIDEWGGLENTMIMGDFNAVPEEAEIAMLYDEGLQDVHKIAGSGSGLTWVHYEPYRRIDYIWATPDLEVFDCYNIYSTASDHLPVVASVKFVLE
ncbi:MAG: endonuclease/exonuclease/phosphatase family protein [Actinomycetia bacterium]|nr:endonuclease/exonuclease/phosphatase family protein [Actinomycetes bacterium]